MKNYYTIRRERKNARKSHKFTIFMGIFLLILLVVSLYIVGILFPIQKTKRQVSKAAFNQTNIVSIKNFKESNRNGTYYSVRGTDNDKTSYIALFNSKKRLIKKVPANKRVSNSKLDSIYKKYKIRKVYSFDPSYYRKHIVFELSYKGKKNSLNYLTINFYNGKIYRSLKGI